MTDLTVFFSQLQRRKRNYFLAVTTNLWIFCEQEMRQMETQVLTVHSGNHFFLSSNSFEHKYKQLCDNQPINILSSIDICVQLHLGIFSYNLLSTIQTSIFISRYQSWLFLFAVLAPLQSAWKNHRICWILR